MRGSSPKERKKRGVARLRDNFYMPENPYAVSVFIGTVVAFAGELTAAKEADLKIGGWMPCDGRALKSVDPDSAPRFALRLGQVYLSGMPTSRLYE